jgi:hypothetical protein
MLFIFIWSVVAAFVIVFFRSHWSLTAWLREAFNVTWPLGSLIGLLSLLAAYAYRRQKDAQGSYRFMRFAAIAFLARCSRDAMVYCSIPSLSAHS